VDADMGRRSWPDRFLVPAERDQVKRLEAENVRLRKAVADPRGRHGQRRVD
jgi:hypothetical protein